MANVDQEVDRNLAVLAATSATSAVGLEQNIAHEGVVLGTSGSHGRNPSTTPSRRFKQSGLNALLVPVEKIVLILSFVKLF